MHPRTSYLAASGEDDTNQEPLLAHEDYPVLLPDVEPSASSSTSPAKEPKEIKEPSPGKGQDSDHKANPSPTSLTPEKAEGYGLPTGYQAQYAEGPPDTQAMRADNQITRQPALPPVPRQNHRMQMLGSFDDAPAVVTCANCGVTGHTFVYKESGCCVYFSAISCLLLGCWPCMWIPFCMRPCKDSVHRCSNCGLVLGKHAWGR